MFLFQTGKMLSHLMTPIDATKSGEVTSSEIPDSTSELPQDVHAAFVAKNISLLQSLEAGDRLIEACCSLPELKQYISQWEDATAGEGTCFPASTSEALAHRQTFARLAEEVDAAWCRC
jgi:E3 ubiquitin-protein ligases UBR4 N-terminal